MTGDGGVRAGFGYTGFYDVGSLLALARQLDTAGGGTVWLAEHLGYRDAFVPASAILSRTERVAVALTAVSPYGRNIVLTAMQAATLSELAPGRVKLVLGAGNPSAYAAAGVSQSAPVQTVREWLRALRQLLSGAAVDWDTDVLRLSGAALHVEPASPPPLLVAAIGPKMTRVAVEEADGLVLTAGLPHERVGATVERARSAAPGPEAAGSTGEVVSFVVAATHDDHRAAVEQARDTLTYMVRNPAVARELRAAGMPLDDAALREHLGAGQWQTARDMLSDDMVQRCAIVGGVEDFRRRLREYDDAGVAEVVLLPAGGGDEAQAVAALLPHVASRG